MLSDRDAPDRLVITLDIECDADGGPTWRYSSPLTFRGVEHGLGEVLGPMLDELGACATLLISNVVMKDQASVALLRDLRGVELGSHLHGDFLAPDPRHIDPAGAKTVDNQNEYSDEIERAKMEALGNLFTEGFGRAPTSFRAGRWSAAGRTASLLAELGYTADSSVSPHVHWCDGGRSVDYRGAPEQPYRPGSADIARPGELALWELPVSIVTPWWARRRPIWLRPSLSPARLMRLVVADMRRRHPPPRTFVVMLHNTELTPGTSPHSRTPDDARVVARRLRDFLSWAIDDGIHPMTLAAVAEACESS
ncbi:MAG TPA: hypothetical protein VM142_00010 [Acidimicrobiales bacterium]|nr:hypothetical protein [Acidimicrobiales bacterium]